MAGGAATSSRYSLAQDEREALMSWVSGGRSPNATFDERLLSQRASIVLACADGASDTAAAASLGQHRATVRRWRRLFQNEGLENFYKKASVYRYGRVYGGPKKRVVS